MLLNETQQDLHDSLSTDAGRHFDGHTLTGFRLLVAYIPQKYIRPPQPYAISNRNQSGNFSFPGLPFPRERCNCPRNSSLRKFSAWFAP